MTFLRKNDFGLGPNDLCHMFGSDTRTHHIHTLSPSACEFYNIVIFTDNSCLGFFQPSHEYAPSSKQDPWRNPARPINVNYSFYCVSINTACALLCLVRRDCDFSAWTRVMSVSWWAQNTQNIYQKPSAVKYSPPVLQTDSESDAVKRPCSSWFYIKIRKLLRRLYSEVGAPPVSRQHSRKIKTVNGT